MKPSSLLKSRIKSGGLVVSVGVHDPLSAVIAERAGFDAGAYQTAQACAAEAIPDISFRTPYEIVESVRKITRRVHFPVIVDSEQGWGPDPVQCGLWTRELIRAGAAAQHIDDQLETCIWLQTKKGLVDADLVAERIRHIAAVRHEMDPDYVIIARTSAYHASVGGDNPEGFEESIRRMILWRDAGADVLTATGWHRTPEIVREVKARVQAPIYMQGSNTHHRDSPYFEYCKRDWDQLHSYGLNIINEPTLLISLSMKAMMDGLRTVKEQRKWAAVVDECPDYDGWLDLVGHKTIWEEPTGRVHPKLW